MTLQLLHSEFPSIWGKFDFLFNQCSSTGVLSEVTSCLDRTQVEAGPFSRQDLWLGRDLRLYRSLVCTGLLPVQDSCIYMYRIFMWSGLSNNPTSFRTLAWKWFLSRQYSCPCLERIFNWTGFYSGHSSWLEVTFVWKWSCQGKTLFWTTFFFWIVWLSGPNSLSGHEFDSTHESFLERILVWPRTLSVKCSCLDKNSV